MSRSQEKHSRWNRYQSSTGHFVMMSKGNRRNQERKWLRNQDESEWSLNTSLMLRFGALFPEFAGHSLRRMFPL